MLGSAQRWQFRTIHGLAVRKSERPGRYWFLVCANVANNVMNVLKFFATMISVLK
jgi:hypothetical protein